MADFAVPIPPPATEVPPPPPPPAGTGGVWARWAEVGKTVAKELAAAMPPPALDALVVRPGDTLLIRIAPGASHQQVATLKAGLADWLPDVKTVVIVAEQLGVVCKGDNGG